VVSNHKLPPPFFQSGQLMCEFHRTDHILATLSKLILDNNINQIHNPIKSRKHSRFNPLVTQRLSQSTNGKTANHKEVQWNLTARGAAAEALSFSSKKGLAPIESYAARCHHFRQPLIAHHKERGAIKRRGPGLPPLTFPSTNYVPITITSAHPVPL